MLAFSTTTFGIYLISFTFVRMNKFGATQLGPQQATLNSQSVIARRKIAEKVSRVMIFSSLVYLATASFQNSSYFILAKYFPAFMVTVGQYWGVLSFVDGSVCFFTFALFIQDFRKQLAIKLGIFTTQQPTGGNVVVPMVAIGVAGNVNVPTVNRGPDGHGKATKGDISTQPNLPGMVAADSAV